MKGRDRPLLELREVLNELLRRNDRTTGAEAGEMYLGKDILVVRLRRPKVVEGEWRDLEMTVDVMDLMDMHDNEGDG